MDAKEQAREIVIDWLAQDHDAQTMADLQDRIAQALAAKDAEIERLLSWADQYWIQIQDNEARLREVAEGAVEKFAHLALVVCADNALHSWRDQAVTHALETAKDQVGG